LIINHHGGPSKGREKAAAEAGWENSDKGRVSSRNITSAQRNIAEITRYCGLSHSRNGSGK